jgi:hypothetical protein
VGDRHDHVLFLDQVLDLDLGLGGHDLRAARSPKRALMSSSSVTITFISSTGSARIARRRSISLLSSSYSAASFSRSRPVSARGASRGWPWPGARRGSSPPWRRPRCTRPRGGRRGAGTRRDRAAAASRLVARLVRVAARADGLHDAIDVARGHAQALHQLALRLRLTQLVAAAAGDDLAAVIDEVDQRLLQIEHLGRPLAMDRLMTPKLVCRSVMR